jgi:serine protease Do
MIGDHSQPAKNRGVFSIRRIVLLATTAAAIGGTAFGFVLAPNVTAQFPSAHAQNLSKQAVRNEPHPVGFADIVQRVKPAVISVRVQMNATPNVSLSLPFPQGSPMDRFFRRFGFPDDLPQGLQPDQRKTPHVVTGQGSGFFISADGYAVTNNHVVDKAEKVQVLTDNGKTYTAKVIGTDPRTDVALIKVDGRNDFPYVSFAEQPPRIGDWVLAVGNPFGLGGTVTAGIVSASGRDIGAGPYDDFIQIDAPVNRGNSGGPAFDVNGHVIGVNTAIFSPSGGNVGIAFAIPAATVKSVVLQLKAKGMVMRGWIGVKIQPVTSEIADSLNLKEARGALVAEPQANSPAVKAGIQAGDVITAVNGNAVKDARQLARTIGAMAPGTTVKLTLLRKGKEMNISLTLGELPNQQEANATPTQGDQSHGTDVPRLGLTLAPASAVAGSGKEGVVVTNVEPDGIAAQHGFKTGDVIIEVAGKKVSKPSDVRSALADAQKGGKHTVLMRVRSADGTKFVAIRLRHA